MGPGTRVLCYDGSRFIDDFTTPALGLYKPATVVKWYGRLADHYTISDMTLGPYPEVFDVVFDERPEIVSYGHLSVETVESIQEGIAAGKYLEKHGIALLQKAQQFLKN